MMREDLRELIQKELQKHNLVDAGLNVVSEHIGNKDLKKHLKREIILRWVDIRAASYVNITVEERFLSACSDYT